MGIVDRFLAKRGFKRIDLGDPVEPSETDDGEIEAMGKVIEMPTPKHMKVEVDLDLTVRQELAFRHPFRNRMAPPRECFDTEKLAGGFSIVKSLLVSPADNGVGLVWNCVIAAFQPTSSGRAVIKPKGKLRGVMVTRAQKLLSGVGEINAEHAEWKDRKRQFVMWRSLTHEEETEFKRIHGEKWVADALRTADGSVLDWQEEDSA